MFHLTGGNFFDVSARRSYAPTLSSIDTSPNVIKTIQPVHYLPEPGGVSVDFGPLPWIPSVAALELSLDEVSRAVMSAEFVLVLVNEFEETGGGGLRISRAILSRGCGGFPESRSGLLGSVFLRITYIRLKLKIVIDPFHHSPSFPSIQIKYIGINRTFLHQDCPLSCAPGGRDYSAARFVWLERLERKTRLVRSLEILCQKFSDYRGIRDQAIQARNRIPRFEVEATAKSGRR